MNHWPDAPAQRLERVFGEREVLCFVQRPDGLDALLEQVLAKTAEREAIVDGAHRLTYAQLEQRVGRLAHGLAQRGIGDGDCVALALGNRFEFLECVLAIARLGAIAVPMNVREQRAGLNHVLADSTARALLFDAEFAARMPVPSELADLEWAAVLASQNDRPEDGSPDQERLTDAEPYDALLATDGYRPPARPVPEAVAVLLYTSGTTGRPKGAMLSHINLVHSVMHYRACVGLRDAERTVLAVPSSHVTGLVGNLLATLGVGGCNIVLRQFDAKRFLTLAAAEAMTYTILVPAMYKLCMLRTDFAQHDLSAWRLGGYGGAPMPVALIEELTRILPALELVNLYGATETTSPTTATPPGYAISHADSVGQPVACADVKVMDDDNREVAPGTDGELWIKGPMVVSGYWRQPELSKHAFPDGYWRSGDIGCVDADGWVRLRDRKKDLVNRAGYKVYSVEVENVVASFEGVLECAVVAQPDPVLGEKIRLFVRVQDQALDVAALRRHCAQQLADYKVPDFITQVNGPLPRNAGGKVLKAELRRQIEVVKDA